MKATLTRITLVQELQSQDKVHPSCALAWSLPFSSPPALLLDGRAKLGGGIWAMSRTGSLASRFISFAAQDRLIQRCPGPKRPRQSFKNSYVLVRV